MEFIIFLSQISLTHFNVSLIKLVLFQVFFNFLKDHLSLLENKDVLTSTSKSERSNVTQKWLWCGALEAKKASKTLHILADLKVLCV